MEQYRSWPFRTATERNSGDSRANANVSEGGISMPLQARKTNINAFNFLDYQSLEQNEHNE
jgi:hypothetical protein